MEKIDLLKEEEEEKAANPHISKTLYRPETPTFLSHKVGVYVPSTRFDSADFELTQEQLRAKKCPEWLIERHFQMPEGTGKFLMRQDGKDGPGIHYRHFASPTETLQMMANHAILRLNVELTSPSVHHDKEKTGLVIANFTSPLLGEIETPSATRPNRDKQQQLLEGVADAWGLKPLDCVNEACAGFIGAVLRSAEILESDPSIQNIVVVAVERFGDILNFDDPSTAILFGDYATASMMTKTKIPGLELIGGYKETSFSQKDIDTLGIGNDGKFYMKGPQTLVAAVKGMSRAVIDLANELKVKDIDMVIPHQPNERIITSVGEKLDHFFPGIKMITDIKGSNVSAGTIPRAMAHMQDPEFRRKMAEKLKCSVEALDTPIGQIIAMTAIGAGIHLNSALFRKVA